MENKIHLSVIIPAFNEEKRLPSSLSAIGKYLSLQDYSYEIIVACSGSTDNTAGIVKEMQKSMKFLKLVDRGKSLGKGYAVKQGMMEAEGEYRIFTDADNSTPIEQVEKMWPYFKQGYDLVIGSRDAKGAVLDPPQPFYRRVLGDVFRILTQIICGTHEILDSQCGFKGLTKKAALDIFPLTRINHFAFDPEVLVIAKKKGYRIKEIPIFWKNDPDSKVKFKNMLEMLRDLFKIRWNMINKRYDR